MPPPTLSASALTKLLSLRRVVNNASSVKRLGNNSRVTNHQTSRIMWTNIQSMMFGSSSSLSSERPAKGNSDPAEDVIESLRKLATSAERAHNRYPLPKNTSTGFSLYWIVFFDLLPFPTYL